MNKNDECFYQDLPAFGNFSDFSNAEIYHSVPDSWWVFVADIRGSTAAIEAGRYRDVNMVGAACIASALNSVKPKAIPYVFGGDGATILCPTSLKESVTKALMQVQSNARDLFSFNLRVGCVQVAALRSEGKNVLLAKYQLAEGVHIALLRGGGLSRAESLIKENLGKAEIFENSKDMDKPNLEGLSCRFVPFHTRRGTICSVLVKVRDSQIDPDILYLKILHKIEEITKQRLEEISPVQSQNMFSHWPPEGFTTELKALSLKNKTWMMFPYVAIRTLVTYILMNFEPWFGPFDARKYKEETIARSDHKKFDDMLRLVIDCTRAEILEFEEFLEGLHRGGLLDYGIHLSSEALMTCLLFKPTAGEHIHFIDGNNGGYALAAKDMKRRMSETHLVLESSGAS